MESAKTMDEIIYAEMTLEELIVITNALSAVKPVDFNRTIDSDEIYTTLYCRNFSLKNRKRHLEIYKDMMWELERRGVIKESWAVRFD